jgi:hydroxyethylthiazole kinase-like uncharacterized protein yjeF
MDRKLDSHKGQNGKVGVIGGSVDFAGAPSLSAQAALRAGCDLTKIVTSESVSDVVSSYSENLIVSDFPSNYLGFSGVENCLEMVRWSDVFLIGPGLSRPDTEAVNEILSRKGKTAVVDADAIKPAVNLGVSNAVLTPHSGEAKIIESEYGSIENFVDSIGDVVVILKGSVDRIYSEDGVTEIENGHPGMTVGGTGDVLAGIVASLISQGLCKERAAVKAVEINGKAGEEAAEEYGCGLVATDLLDKIPKSLSK